jgi:hypothetical protein
VGDVCLHGPPRRAVPRRGRAALPPHGSTAGERRGRRVRRVTRVDGGRRGRRPPA